MKHSQLRFLDHQPYIASSIKCQYSEAIPKKAKHLLDQLNQNPAAFRSNKDPMQKHKIEKAKLFRLYNQSSEHLPKIKQHKDHQHSVISERNSNSLMRSTLNNSNTIVQKYSVFEAHYNIGISSGKNVQPVKLQKKMWKQSLEYLLKSHHGY